MASIIEALFYLFFIVTMGYGIIYVLANMIAYIGSSFIKKDEHKINSKLHSIDISEPGAYIAPYQIKMSHDEYEAYLKSDKWQDKRLFRLIVDDFTCQVCGADILPSTSNPNIANVHHLHYRNLGHEDIKNDLVSLCKECHTSMHAKFTIPEMEQEINLIRMQRQ